MAHKPMPGKLVLVVLWMVIGAIAALATGGIVTAGIQAALIVGVLAGNDGVRTFLRGLAVIQILWNLTLITAAASETHASTGAIAIFAAFGVGAPAFLVWALGQQDVRDWMFRKNFNLDDPGSSTPKL